MASWIGWALLALNCIDRLGNDSTPLLAKVENNVSGENQYPIPISDWAGLVSPYCGKDSFAIIKMNGLRKYLK